MKPENLNKCSVDGCLLRANRVGAGLCEKHYMRLRRNGNTDNRKMKERYSHSGGYSTLLSRGHPLADKKGRIYEHRKVYFDAYGDGVFQCHVCQADIGWHNMHVDHLNDVKTDNKLSNLAPACATCNQARGADKMRQTMRMKVGKPVTYNGETLSFNQWSERLGVPRATLLYRIKRMGMTIEQAFTKPMGATSGNRRRQQEKSD